MDANTQIDNMEQHLLFHKSLTEDVESFDKINGYIGILKQSDVGEKLNNPVDESIRAVFSLVLEKGIDPWEINLNEFVKLYSNKVIDNNLDMIVAGKLVLMAWKILRLQSDATRSRVDEPVSDDFFEFDFSFEDEDEFMPIPEVSFKRAYQRDTIRPVTMYELLDAFEEARVELEIQQERDRIGKELKDREPKKFDNKAHDEDDERDVERIWRRIEELGTESISINSIYTKDIMENLRAFIAVLHLVRDGKLTVWQDGLLTSEIFIKIYSEALENIANQNVSEMVN